MKYSLIFMYIFTQSPSDLDLSDYVTQRWDYYHTLERCQVAAYKRAQIELVANGVDVSSEWERKKFKWSYICYQVPSDAVAE